MIEAVLTGVTGLFVAITLAQCWQRPSWWVRDWDFPRLQLSLLLGVLLGAQVALLSYARAWHFGLPLVTGACLAYQLWWITPYTRLWPLEVQWASKDNGQPRISIMAANVLTPNRGADRLLAMVRECRPDVLVLLETDQWWDTQIDVLTTDYPYSIRCPLDNLYGMHVFSRLPLEDPQLCFLIEPDVPSMHARVLVNENLSIRMHFLHPTPPSPTESDESTERDAELLVVARSVQDDTGPVIVTGDLNDVAWSTTTHLFRKISGLLDPRVGRGMFNTFHAQHWFLRWPLDHFFHSAHFKVVRIRRLPEFGSDHFPIFIELQFDDDYVPQQHGLEPSDADRRQASEKIEKEPAKPADVPDPAASRRRVR